MAECSDCFEILEQTWHSDLVSKICLHLILMVVFEVPPNLLSFDSTIVNQHLELLTPSITQLSMSF